ncbi:MAG: crotonase/enoyl-CoA hydratase family protein [Pseudorhodoplanes sp.]
MNHIAISDQGSVRIIRMNRPEKKNALTAAMYDALATALEELNTNPVLHCAVIMGVPGAFSAGNDLQDFLEASKRDSGLGQPILRFLYALARCEKPLVAAVQGLAVGIGTTMLLHCDHVIAGTDTRFMTPFVNLGLVPEAGSSLLAPRVMGYHNAFALLVMGRTLDASEAKDCGLVNVVVPADTVDSHALQAAEQIAALPSAAVAASRRLLRGSAEEIVAQIDKEAEQFRERLKSPEAQGAFAAFLNRKR